MHDHRQDLTAEDLTLIVGGTGKTGRRVADRLLARGLPVRAVSRGSEPRFDWDDPGTWDTVLEGVTAAYVTYSPDLAVPEAPAAIAAFAGRALEHGVRKLVLLSGRGEEEAQRCERLVQDVNPDWCVVRASWFSQNFSEAFFLEPLQAGTLALPAGTVGEPFIDAEDLADVAVAALTESGHEGEIYEVTGPRLLTFAEAVAEIGRATGRPLRYQQVPTDGFVAAMREQGNPEPVVALVRYLFETVLDGRNAQVTDGVQRALGRPARDFADYVRRTVATGIWAVPRADPETILRRFIDEVVNRGDEAALAELVHPDYVYRSPGEELRGPEGIATKLRSFRRAFADLHVAIDDLVVAGETTVTSFTLTGTHRGELLGMAPTGNRVRVQGMVRSRFRDGRIAEEWELLDQLSMFEQLGIGVGGGVA